VRGFGGALFDFVDISSAVGAAKVRVSKIPEVRNALKSFWNFTSNRQVLSQRVWQPHASGKAIGSGFFCFTAKFSQFFRGLRVAVFRGFGEPFLRKLLVRRGTFAGQVTNAEFIWA
jgi:hypothetical protein